MEQLFIQLAKTPLPTILVVGGLLFLFLGIAGKLGASIAISSQKQLVSGSIGFVLLLGGIVLYVLRLPPIEEGGEVAPVSSTPAPTSSVTPSTAPVTEPSPRQPSPARTDIVAQATENWLWGDYTAALRDFAQVSGQSDDPAMRELAQNRLEWLEPYRNRIIFADDFEQDTISSQTRWTIHPPGPGTGTGQISRVRRDGQFLLEGHGHYHAAARIREDVVPHDFEIQLRFRPVTSAQGGAHINLMMDESEGRTTIGLYMANAELSVWEEKSGHETRALERHEFSDRWYRLRAVVAGSLVEVFLDDRRVLDYSSPRRRISLKQFNLEPLGGTLQFDDVLVVSR